MRDPALYLKDILESIDLIEQFVSNMEFEDFKRDIKTSDAVIKRFENIGEAAKKVPDGIKGKYPDIPWKEMAGMRGTSLFISGWRGLPAKWRTERPAD
ncbi:MAG: DUF86 domain-containing protein [Nitrospiraceae bacterium]|nr:DUF86 domain-containing protein [Nitrospiraceae bacterium]